MLTAARAGAGGAAPAATRHTMMAAHLAPLLACAAATLLADDPYAQNRTVLAHNLARRFDPEHGLLA
jgi:hypothetical protein